LKICSISGRNLASLADPFRVDFETEPLAGAGLFAITGPTGAGKSTLLDALCLALFNCTPRLSTRGGAVIGLESDLAWERLATNDVRALVRRGASEATAEVEFLGRDGRRYRATWSVRRARGRADGKLQDEQVELRDLARGEVLGGTKTEVLADISKRLGLDFEQFRRSVVLAQGEFAAFLRAKEDERAALLEQMTGAHLYSAVSRKAYERAKEEEAALSQLVALRAQTSPLAEAQRAALEAEEGALTHALEAARRDVEAAARDVAWFDGLARLRAEVEAAQGAQQGAREALEAAAPRREALSRAQAAQAVRGVYEAWQTSRERARAAAEAAPIAVAAHEAATAALDVARGANAGALQAHAAAVSAQEASAGELQRARDLDVRIQAKLQERERLASAARAARALETEVAARLPPLIEEQAAVEVQGDALRERRVRLVHVSALAGAWASLRPALVAAGGRLAKAREVPAAAVPAGTLSSTEALLEAQRNLEGAEARLQAAQTAAVQVSSMGEAVDRGALRDELKRAEALGLVLEQLARTWDAWSALVQRGQALRARAGEQQRAASVALEAAATLEARALATARAERETLERAVGALTAAASLREHRAALHEDQPCPLCGSSSHPWAGRTEALDQRLHARSEALAGLQRREKALAEEALQRRSEGRTHEALALEHERETVAVQREAEQVAESWRRAVASVGKGAPAGPAEAQARLWTSAQRDGLVEGRERLEEQLRVADVREAAQREVARALGEARERVHSAELVLGLEQALAALAAPLEGLSGWRASFLEAPAEVLRRLDRDVEEWAAAGQAEERLEVLRRELERRVLECTKERETLESHVADRERELSAAGLVAAQLSQERAALLAGREADGVERALRAAVGDRQRAVEVSSAALQAQELARARTEGALREAGAHAELLRQLEERSHDALLRGLEGTGVDAGELEALLAWPPRRIEAEAEALRALEEAAVAAGARLEDRRGQLQRHEGALARPLGAEEAARRTLGDLSQAHEAAHQRLGAAQQRRAQDDEARFRDAQLAERLAAQSRRAEQWGRLRDVVGSADGKKFRTFAQSLTFEVLLEQANLHLAELARRYALVRVPNRNLEVQVVDHDLADEVRSTASLSGGETFLVSLALALGLSSLGASGVRIESLFIDEGFGTLDPQTLEVALDALDALQATGCKVGIISHVPGLEARLAAQVRVRRVGSGRSVVEVGR
jgi:exonuclease SbcC